MEELSKYFTKNILSCIFSVACLVTPGILTVGIFNRALFLELDIIKLILLSCAIGIPTLAYFIVMFTLRMKNEDGPSYIIMGFMANMIVFSIALIIKIFIRDLTLRGFVIALIVGSLIFTVIIKDERT